LFYTTTPPTFQPIVHTARYNIDLDAAYAPGLAFSAMGIKRRSGTPTGLDAYVDAWIALVQVLYSTNANNTLDFVELWKYAPLSFNADFMSVYAVNLAGTTALGATPAHQSILTFRTLEGGLMKMSFMETVSTGNNVDTPPLASAGLEAIQTFVVSTGNGFLAADTSYPFACRAHLPGQNEALFRKRYRA
jgi:hypothetical protein